MSSNNFLYMRYLKNSKTRKRPPGQNYSTPGVITLPQGKLLRWCLRAKISGDNPAHWAPGGDSDVLDVRITSETAPHAPELPTAVRGGNGPLVGGNIYNLNAQWPPNLGIHGFQLRNKRATSELRRIIVHWGLWRTPIQNCRLWRTVMWYCDWQWKSCGDYQRRLPAAIYGSEQR